MKRISWGFLSAIAVVLLFLYFVYPTRYIYLDVPLHFGDVSSPVRVDRITGNTQVFQGIKGWVTLSPN